MAPHVAPHDMARAKAIQPRSVAVTTLQAVLPLHLESRVVLPTREAAFHLGRSGQTLRMWACRESGPIRPRRVNGRLAWPTAEIKKLLGVA